MVSSLVRIFIIYSVILLSGLESHPVQAQAKSCLKEYFAKKTLGIAQPGAEKLIKDIGSAMAIMSEIQVVPCMYAEQVESTFDDDDDTDIPRGEYIIYNPTWVQQVIGKNKVETIAIFGHELGHFVQRHFSTRSRIDRIQQEVEADYFAGCAVASMGNPWGPMAELLERIRNENDEVYPNRLKSLNMAKQGYDTCLRSKIPMIAPVQPQDKMTDRFKAQVEVPFQPRIESPTVSRTKWTPNVDTYNDRYAYRLNQDMVECRQLASFVGSDNQFKRAFISCLSQRKHTVVTKVSDTSEPIGSTEEGQLGWSPIVDTYNNSNVYRLT